MQRIIIRPLFLFQASAHIQQPNTDDPADTVCKANLRTTASGWVEKGKEKNKKKKKTLRTKTRNNQHLE